MFVVCVRVLRSCCVDGFLLDRRFQVYLDAYPETGKLLDLAALDLKAFEPGALISVSLLGLEDSPHLADSVKAELRAWFGVQVDGWEWLRSFQMRTQVPALIASTASLSAAIIV